MKKILSVVLSLIFVFAVTSVSFAAETKDAAADAPSFEQQGKAASAKMQLAKTPQVTGEITAIDAAAKTVTVKGRKGDVTLSINDKTKIKMEKEAKTLEDLKAGDKVTVKYTETDGKNMAKSVKIKTASKKTRSKETPEGPKE